MKLVVATKNRGKLDELTAMLAPLGIEIVRLSDLGIAFDVVEDAATFSGNAEKKARALHHATGLGALGDDSGLEVDALGGAPGVFSARYAGEGHNDRANNEKLLRELASVPDEKRTAQFRCALALVDEHGALTQTEGSCEGQILHAPRGENGFGYDPLFLVPKLGCTLAELTLDEKNRISHRAQALHALAKVLLARQF